MLGAIIGDIVGSRFEWNNINTKDFTLLTPDCFFTDDTVMTAAVANAIMECNGDYADLGECTVQSMRQIGRNYPGCGYGASFQEWLFSEKARPYNSYGNGAAMRISACGVAARSLKEAKQLSHEVTVVTHNHPEGLKGAEATAAAIYMALTGSSIDSIRDYIHQMYYPMDFTLNEIRDSYQFNETCQGTVPQAIEAFLESTDFEDAIRNAISIGGDSDTLAAITGGIAEAYYGIPLSLRRAATAYLDERLLKILQRFDLFRKKQCND